jgi:HAD superfamily hydrolase (TIGR01509 family)
MIKAVLIDIDGTLVDSNDAHAHAWQAAFADAGIVIDLARIRRCIGMGGDKLMPAVASISEDSELGRRISKRKGEIFQSEWLPTLQPFRDADRLLAELKARGFRLVAATSARRDELRSLLKIAHAERLLDGAASSDDAEESKPDPDIVHAALREADTEPDSAVMIGDTPYDIEAATAAGVRIVAFRCGGWSDEELAGAIAVYDGPWQLLEELQGSVFGGAR